MKLIKKYSKGKQISNTDYDKEIHLSKNPNLETNYFNRLPNNIKADVITDTWEPPKIDPTLPNDHRANVRAAIAQQNGWVEVPIKEINLDANREYEESIRKAATKFGPDATYIVDPNTMKIIPEKVFDELITNIALLNTSGNITNNRLDFENQKQINHRQLLENDPQKLGLVLGVAGAASNPVGLEALNILATGQYLAEAAETAKTRWNNELYVPAVVGGLSDAAIAFTPFKGGTVVKTTSKFAPKVGATLSKRFITPLVFGGATALGAYAESLDDSNVDPASPEGFVSTISETDKAEINNPSINWQTVGNNEAQRKYWSDIIQKELMAAGFTFDSRNDEFGLDAVYIYGNKDRTVNGKQERSLPWWYWASIPVRYGTLVPPLRKWAGRQLMKLLKNVKLADIISWGVPILGNVGIDYAAYRYVHPNDAPTEYNYNLPEYYNKLILAYVRLNSGKKNAYVVGSTFGPYQTYLEKNINHLTNLNFEYPDTNHFILNQGELMDSTGGLRNPERETLKQILDINFNLDSLNGGKNN